MHRIVTAGTTYFLVVFASGFLFGAIRTFFLAPVMGATAAVVLEVPLILMIAWAMCLKIIDRFQIKTWFFHRLAMGALAFSFLLIAEFLLAVMLSDQPLVGFVQDLQTPRGAIGLAGQVLFGLFPILDGCLRKNLNGASDSKLAS